MHGPSKEKHRSCQEPRSEMLDQLVCWTTAASVVQETHEWCHISSKHAQHDFLVCLQDSTSVLGQSYSLDRRLELGLKRIQMHTYQNPHQYGFAEPQQPFRGREDFGQSHQQLEFAVNCMHQGYWTILEKSQEVLHRGRLEQPHQDLPDYLRVLELRHWEIQKPRHQARVLLDPPSMGLRPGCSWSEVHCQQQFGG